jgi:hypothetical protein
MQLLNNIFFKYIISFYINILNTLYLFNYFNVELMVVIETSETSLPDRWALITVLPSGLYDLGGTKSESLKEREGGKWRGNWRVLR